MGSCFDKLLPATLPLLGVFFVHVTHALGSNIKGQADSILGILHVASTLHDVLWLKVKCDRAIDLFEEAAEKAEMVIFPLNLSWNLVHKLGVWKISACFCQCALIASL